MASLQWNESYSVKIEEMDQQHRTLLDLLNKLGDSISMRNSKDVLAEIISDLAQYTRTHFKAEEGILAKHHYPALAAQKAMHQHFIDKIAGFDKMLENNDIALGIQLIQFLTDWLIKHIIVEDKKYSSFLNEKRIE
jgi:hemerythrin